MKYRHDLPLWITEAPQDFAPHEPRKRFSLFDPAPEWALNIFACLLFAVGCFGFWCLFLHQLAESTS